MSQCRLRIGCRIYLYELPPRIYWIL